MSRSMVSTPELRCLRKLTAGRSLGPLQQAVRRSYAIDSRRGAYERGPLARALDCWCVSMMNSSPKTAPTGRFSRSSRVKVRHDEGDGMKARASEESNDSVVERNSDRWVAGMAYCCRSQRVPTVEDEIRRHITTIRIENQRSRRRTAQLATGERRDRCKETRCGGKILVLNPWATEVPRRGPGRRNGQGQPARVGDGTGADAAHRAQAPARCAGGRLAQLTTVEGKDT